MIAPLNRLGARLAACFLAGILGLRAEIQCTGIFVVSQKTLLAFANTETKNTSGWVNLGDSFDGYVVTSFDREKEMVTLKRAEQVLEVRLRQSKIQDGVAPGSLLSALPPLETIKGLIGLEEIIARRGRAEIETRLLERINAKPESERAQFLADLMTGKQKNIFVPMGGMTDAFARKYNLTSQQIASAKAGEEIGRIFVENERKSKTSGSTSAAQPVSP
ncbi:MAG TPA: hypothetical protein VHM90_09235 [Phycisphaerae bacterium]|nr:hypothetical protein [Phycisphaerae bacterium]